MKGYKNTNHAEVELDELLSMSGISGISLATKHERACQLDIEDVYTEIGLYSVVEPGYKEPKRYKDMLKRDKPEREQWLKGCEKELANFEKRGTWKVVKIKDIPKGRRLIGSKWVFKLKHNGIYRS